MTAIAIIQPKSNVWTIAVTLSASRIEAGRVRSSAASLSARNPSSRTNWRSNLSSECWVLYASHVPHLHTPPCVSYMLMCVCSQGKGALSRHDVHGGPRSHSSVATAIQP